MQDTFIFVDFSKDEYAQLIRGMYSHRVQILFAANLSEMFRLVPTAKNPFIIVGLPIDDSANEVVQNFLKLSRLEEFCFVFVGRDVQRIEGKIGKVLPHSIALNIPATGDDVLGAVDYLRSHQRAIREQIESPAVSDAATRKSRKGFPKVESLVSGVSRLCFQALQTLDTRDISLGCSPIFRASKVSDLESFTYRPTSNTVKEIAQRLTEQAGKRGAVHLHRAAAVSSRILGALNIEGEILESARNAAFLFSWNFIAHPELFTVDYLLSGKADVRQKFAQLISQSSDKIAQELGLKTEQKIVHTISRLLGDDYRIGDDSHDLISSTIMTSDLVDRVCWQHGHWDPRGVHLLMHRFSAADVPDIHPQVLAITLKSLCEALEGMGAHLLRARAIAKHPQLEFQLQAKQSIVEQSDKEQRVLLSCLKPGMKTSRPVLTFDGRTIVSRNTLLDEDLIWRLWQLAAVRPLDPVHVTIRSTS